MKITFSRAGMGVGALLAGLAGWMPAYGDAAQVVKMSPATHEFLNAILTAEQLQAVVETLSHADAWGSLGPRPGGQPAPLPYPQPEARVTLEIPDDARGSGTAEDPYVDVISAFLEQFDYNPAHIESFERTPRAGRIVDPERVERYMETLAYELVTVVIPPGYYVETIRNEEHPARARYQDRWNIGLRIPPGIWLEGEGAPGSVVIRPALAEEEMSGLLMLVDIRSGLVNVTLDGESVGPWEVGPDYHVSAVQVAHHATLASNHIRYFNGTGVRGFGARRGQAGTAVVLSNNIIEYIGQTGVGPTSGWMVRDNQLRYAGILSTTGGGGNDVIIPRHSEGGEIVNNLIIGERKPTGRHVIGHQEQRGSLVAGNIVAAVNGIRNVISASDGSHMLRYVGNLALNLGETGRSAQAGLTINGYGAVIEHNASIGNPSAFRAAGRPDHPTGYVRYNYAEYTHTCIHTWGDRRWGRNREEYGNVCQRIEAPLPVVDMTEFGFFVPEKLMP